jgi:uncharacterized protein
MTPSDPSTWTLPRLRVDKDGAWYHEGEEVTHPGILLSLRAALERDAEGYCIRTGPVRVPVEVEDAPYAVVRFEPEGDGFAVTLNDLTRERLDPETLRLGEGEVPYCRVKGGGFEARFSRSAAYQLLERVEPYADTGRGALRVGGRFYALGS